MKCPKCGHEQEGTVQCGSCGVYFAKLAPPPPQPQQPQAQQPQPQAQRHPQAPPAPRERRASPASGTSGFGPGALIVAILATAAIVYALMRQRTHGPGTQEAASAAAGANAAAPTARDFAGLPRLSGHGTQPTQGSPVRNAIEAARNATVFIKTGSRRA